MLAPVSRAKDDSELITSQVNNLLCISIFSNTINVLFFGF